MLQVNGSISSVWPFFFQNRLNSKQNIYFISVVLKVGGFAHLGAILRDKGAKKTKAAIGGKLKQRG